VRKIQLRDAKANLSAVVDQAASGTPSLITRHGKPVAVIVSFAEWLRLSNVPSFGEFLLSVPLIDGDVPKRKRSALRSSGL
jgi:antitoxin Phd